MQKAMAALATAIVTTRNFWVLQAPAAPLTVAETLPSRCVIEFEKLSTLEGFFLGHAPVCEIVKIAAIRRRRSDPETAGATVGVKILLSRCVVQ